MNTIFYIARKAEAPINPVELEKAAAHAQALFDELITYRRDKFIDSMKNQELDL